MCSVAFENSQGWDYLKNCLNSDTYRSTAPSPSNACSDRAPQSDTKSICDKYSRYEDGISQSAQVLAHSMIRKYLSHLLAMRQYYDHLLNRISFLQVRQSELRSYHERCEKDRVAAQKRQEFAMERKYLWSQKEKQKQEQLFTNQMRVQQSRQASKLAGLIARKKHRQSCLEQAMKTRFEILEAHKKVQQEDAEDLRKKREICRRHLLEQRPHGQWSQEKVLQQQFYIQQDYERLNSQFIILQEQIVQAESKEYSLINVVNQIQAGLQE